MTDAVKSARSGSARGRPIVAVVVVDDSEIVRRAAARCLRRGGFVVLEAASAAEALALLDANRGQIDVLLSDVVLQDMSGIDLVREVHHLQPGIGTALMTGHQGRSARHEQNAEPTAPILLKPFTPSRLLECVHEALRASGSTSAGWSQHAGPPPRERRP